MVSVIHFVAPLTLLSSNPTEDGAMLQLKHRQFGMDGPEICHPGPCTDSEKQHACQNWADMCLCGPLDLCTLATSVDETENDKGDNFGEPNDELDNNVTLIQDSMAGSGPPYGSHTGGAYPYFVKWDNAKIGGRFFECNAYPHGNEMKVIAHDGDTGFFAKTEVYTKNATVQVNQSVIAYWDTRPYAFSGKATEKWPETSSNPSWYKVTYDDGDVGWKPDYWVWGKQDLTQAAATADDIISWTYTQTGY